MDNKFILDFLTDLSKNNDRDWFHAHKERYDMAIELFRSEVSALISGCSRFDGSVAHLRPQDCIYRIYRDIRFSPDKTPYKRHFSAYIAMQGGRKSLLGGYYIHLEPGVCSVGGGIYCPDTEMLRKIRRQIVDHYDELEAIVDDKLFVKEFGKLYSPEQLKRMPLGFPADAPGGDYLKYKHFLVEKSYTDREVQEAGFVERVIESFKIMHPMLNFFNEPLQD